MHIVSEYSTVVTIEGQKVRLLKGHDTALFPRGIKVRKCTIIKGACHVKGHRILRSAHKYKTAFIISYVKGLGILHTVQLHTVQKYKY